MFRSNTSFHCELPDGTERFFAEGQIAADGDPVVELQPDLFTTFDPEPGAGKTGRSANAPRRSSNTKG